MVNHAHYLKCCTEYICCQPISFQESAKGGGKKRERVASEVGESTPKPTKKLIKSAEKPQKTEPPPQDSFTPFDYSQSDLKVFAGMNVILFSSHWTNYYSLHVSLQLLCISKKKIKNSDHCTPFILQIPNQRTTHSLIQTGKPMILRKGYCQSFWFFLNTYNLSYQYIFH